MNVCDVCLRLTIQNVWNAKLSRWASGSRRSENFLAVKQEIPAWGWWLHDSSDYREPFTASHPSRLSSPTKPL